MEKVIRFTPVEFKCACGIEMNIAVVDADCDPEGDHYRIGGEVQCWKCEAKYRILPATEELLRHVEPPEKVKVLERREELLKAIEPEKTPDTYCSKCFKTLPSFSREGGEHICKRCKNKTYRDRARRNRR